MKTIEIKTTQNVTITYALAEVRERILAYLLDMIIKGVLTLILWLIFLLALDEQLFDYMVYFQFIFFLPIMLFYTLASEWWMNGQTLGKRALKIKVIKLDGKQPGFYDYLLRWVFRIIDVGLSGGVLAALTAASTEHAQRIGDIVANCTVVKVESKAPIALRDILKIDNRASYEPKYPQISAFSEEDIVLVKNTLERYNKFRNSAHKSAILELADQMREKLGIEEPVKDRIAFLKTLIKDYIVLTR